MATARHHSASDLEGALRRSGVRITRQRSALLQVLPDAGDHTDANALHASAGALDSGVSLSSV